MSADMIDPDLMMTGGVYRYIPHDALLARLAQGWRYAADLGPVHGEWSSLMWWCIGACEDGEAP
jgi:hypothetical protein